MRLAPVTFRALLALLGAALSLVAMAAAEDAPSGGTALDFAVSPPVIELGPSMSPRGTKDAADPDGAWFTIAVQNRSQSPIARILTAAERPDTALAIEPKRGKPVLAEAAAGDEAVVIERAIAFGTNAFRVLVPPGHAATLALHFRNADAQPSLLAWTEPALVAHNRQEGVLTGLVSGFLLAATGFAAGAAILSPRMFPRWAALFLLGVLVAQLTRSGVFDGTPLVILSGPYALFAFAVAFAVAAGIRLVDYVAQFEAFRPQAGRWRNAAVGVVLGAGVAGLAGVPAAGLAVRLCALIGAAACAGYLAHCGRIGIAAARRLAPAATIFALVTAVAAFNALGFFGVNVVASNAVGGFAAAGALLVALATAVPVEHSLERLREFREAHKSDDTQAVVTDEAYDRERELAAVAASHQGVFDFDFETGLLSLSAEAATLMDLPAGAVEINRESWMERIHPDDRIVFEQALTTYRQHPGTAFRVEFRIRGAGGRTVWCELRATMTGQATEAERCLGLIADVTTRKNFDATENSDLGDDLTGLGNRAALQARLEEIGDDLARSMLAVFDLDRFKAVNDSLGRDGADVALAAFVERLEQRFLSERTSGRLSLYRVGGDMFAALAFDIGDPTTFAENVLAVTTEPFNIAEREVYLVASVGVATGNLAEDGQDLLAQGELAMVEAKRQGGGRASSYSGSEQTRPRDPVALETELRRALERDEIEVHYQPIVRLKDRKVAGFESLLRWRHPTRGVIEPESFVPHAEESGLILPLGRFVLQRAMRDLAQWQRLFPARPPLFVSVNIAWRQISEDGFADEFATMLTCADIAKRSLKLEITESAVMNGADRAEIALQRLRDLGAGLAVDDFGTGHSSLSHLRRFPFEAIKIDKSFLKGAHDKSGAAILRSIIALAHELKLAVVAEGVEAQQEVGHLIEMGCEYGQGFYFGAAIAGPEVSAFLAAARTV